MSARSTCDWNILFCGGRTHVSSGLPPASIRKWFGFHHFQERAFANSILVCACTALVMSIFFGGLPGTKIGDPSSPRKGCIPSAVEGGSRGREAGEGVSVQGPWRLLLIAPGPSLIWWPGRCWWFWIFISGRMTALSHPSSDCHEQGHQGKESNPMTPQRYTVK